MARRELLLGRLNLERTHEKGKAAVEGMEGGLVCFFREKESTFRCHVEILPFLF